MRLGLFDLFTLLGFGLWFAFPIGIYVATHRLYENSDQGFEFERNFAEELGSTDAEVLEFKARDDQMAEISRKVA